MKSSTIRYFPIGPRPMVEDKTYCDFIIVEYELVWIIISFKYLQGYIILHSFVLRNVSLEKSPQRTPTH